MTNKIKNYMIALYASTAIGVGTVAWCGYDTIKEKDISKENFIRTTIGLSAYFALWLPGVAGYFKDKKNNLEGELEN